MVPALMGALINSMFRDGAHIVHTRSADDSAAFLQEVTRRIGKDAEKYLMNVRPNAGSSSDAAVATYAAANIAARRTKLSGPGGDNFVAQLAMIPGVSPGLAKDIAAAFGGSMRELVRRLEACTSRKEQGKLLETVPHVGKKTAGHILDALGF